MLKIQGLRQLWIMWKLWIGGMYNPPHCPHIIVKIRKKRKSVPEKISTFYCARKALFNVDNVDN